MRKILVVGAGGREHALSTRLIESPSVSEVLVCPAHAGVDLTELNQGEGSRQKVLRSVAGEPLQVALSERVDLVVVGPEAPLCEGLVDRLTAAGICCFGPTKAAAQLEGSKAFMKEFCRRHGIAAARDIIVSDASELEAALEHFEASPHPPVVKADGLCAGKGVVVAETQQQAREAAQTMLRGESFGAAGSTVVLEERLLGEEVSIHAICDGESAILLPAAQDHKRIHEGDVGPNTGGMGTYAPAPVVDLGMMERIRKEIVLPVVQGMKKDGSRFVGTLFAGLMVSPTGEPVVLEFNVRFGDPETQVLMPLLDGDFAEALFQAAQGKLKPGVLSSNRRHAMCVVLASAGYPASARKGDPITGLAQAAGHPDVRVYHAGTRLEQGRVVTAGGRVLGVTASGQSLEEARDRAYLAVDCIDFDGKQLRRDIGHRALGGSAGAH